MSHINVGELDLPTFFMTYARSRPDTLIPYIEEQRIPVLTNAIHRWSENTNRLLDMWEYDTPHVIDAGGYNVMADFVTQSGKLSSSVSTDDVQQERAKYDRGGAPFYPYSVEEYHEWLAEWSDEFVWATVMDYACEDRFNVLWDVPARVEATWDTTVRQFNLLDDSNSDYGLLPVLQGRTADEYVSFYERLEDHGIPNDYVGLGTVCRLSSESAIVELEAEIRRRTGVENLHGFGVKVEAFKHGAQFESSDSQAWAYYPSNGRAVLSDNDSLRKVNMSETHLSLERTTISFKEYYDHARKLLLTAYEHGGDETEQATITDAVTALQ